MENEKKQTNLKHIEMPPLPEEPVVVDQVDQVAETTQEDTQVDSIAVEQTAKEFHQEESPSSTSQVNIIALREKAKQAERERDEAFRILQQIKEAQSPKKEQPEEKFEDISPDDLVEGKHLNRFNAKIKDLESQLNEYKAATQATSTEARIKSKYSDFDSIVNAQNIEALRAEYPEIAQTLNSSTDLYSKAVSAYTLIKNLGIAREDKFSKQRETAQANASKPRPLTSVSPQQGDSPLSRANAFANGLTTELKDQLRREMVEARKNR